MKIFNIDSPLMIFLSKMADLMIVNLLTILCCIPIFTAGAAFTAMHYMCYKIVRDEEVYIVKGYFHSFKENFKQSTIIWLIALLIGLIFAADIKIMMDQQVSIPVWVRYGVLAALIFLGLNLLMVFPVQARFFNTIKGTIKTAFVVTMLIFPKVVLMLILYALPWVLTYYFMSLFPIAFLLGISLPAYFAAMLYNKTFKKMEDKFYEDHPEAKPDRGADDEHIFSDNGFAAQQQPDDEDLAEAPADEEPEAPEIIEKAEEAIEEQLDEEVAENVEGIKGSDN